MGSGGARQQGCATWAALARQLPAQHTLQPLIPAYPLRPFLPMFQGEKRAVGRLEAGAVFGEVALLTKAPRQADCVAATP